MEDEKDLIERFFDGALNEQEQQAFQQKLQNDPNFAKAFAVEQDLLEGIESLGNDKLRQELQQIHREEAPALSRATVRPLGGRRWWLTAAALLLGGALAWWLWPQTAPDTQQLYAQYAQHDFSFVQKSGGRGIEKKLLSSAEKSLRKGNYQGGLNSLNQYLELQIHDQEAALAKGIALLEIGDDYPAARAIFKNLVDSKSLLANDGRWYLALLDLKLHNLDACQQHLRSIPKNSARYAKAQELLQQL